MCNKNSRLCAAGVFSDDMVLQRNRPVKIWGYSQKEPGTQITARIGDFSGIGKVRENGSWSLTLPPMPENSQPRTLSVSDGKDAIFFEGVLVGDVYFVYGQSNAELPLKCDYMFEETLDAKISPHDNIRLFFQFKPHVENLNPKDLVVPQEEPIRPDYKWRRPQKDSPCTWEFSAIGYYFAKNIADATKGEVPIGIFNAAYGGASLTHLCPYFINDKYNVVFPPSQITFNAYNTLMHPIENYTTCGMLWYQGETESDFEFNVRERETYFSRLTELWEYIADKSAGRSPYNIYAVQLSSHSTAEGIATARWEVAKTRCKQYDFFTNFKTEHDISVHIIPSLDHGIKETDTDTAHPRYKKPIGERMAKLALALNYGMGDADPIMAPRVTGVSFDETGAVITFCHVGEGLCTYEGGTLVGFELTKNGEAFPGKAEITSPDTVRVSGTANPSGVRYAFYHAAGITVSNLQNSEGIPCPTFAFGEGAQDIPILTRGEMNLTD